MFQITTHSDYMMQRFNQLLKLGQLKEIGNSLFEDYARKNSLNKDTYLDKNIIKGYYFSHGENGVVVITQLKITDDGLPMSTFFDIVTELSRRDDDIDALLDNTKSAGQC